MEKICEHCNSAPATVHLSSFDIDKLCSPCRYKDSMVRSLRRKKK